MGGEGVAPESAPVGIRAPAGAAVADVRAAVRNAPGFYTDPALPDKIFLSLHPKTERLGRRAEALSHTAKPFRPPAAPQRAPATISPSSTPLLAGDEEHVPRPTSQLRPVYVLDLRAIAKLVAVWVGALRHLVVEVDGLQSEFRDCV